MPVPLTPGAYLKRRRTAAGLSLVDVAGRLETTPRLAEHVLAHQLELIEADIAPARLETIVALRWAFRFDLDVLAILAAIHLGAAIPAPRVCRICAGSDRIRCDDEACVEKLLLNPAWNAPDLCADCAVHRTPAEPITA